MTVINSNFTDNKGGATLSLYSSDMTITGCNIFNNSEGITVNEYATATINYNRIFNNTEYDLNNKDNDTNADFNWWGSNTPTKIIGTILNNYFVMAITNLTSLDSNDIASFKYNFQLNDTIIPFDVTLLPYFTTEIYTNLTNRVITSFDARYDNVFNVIINNSGDVLYKFFTDNEV